MDEEKSSATTELLHSLNDLFESLDTLVSLIKKVSDKLEDQTCKIAALEKRIDDDKRKERCTSQ